MTTINISLPESMKVFVEEQIAKGGFPSESEYLRVLIHEAQKRAAQEELEAKLMEGLNSPVSAMTDADWAELKQQVLEHSPELNDS